MLPPQLHSKPLSIIFASILISLFLILSYSQAFHVSPSHLGSASGSKVEASDLSEQSFPKKVWQCWKDDSEDPTERTVGFPHQWRVVNPQYQYERITHDNMETYVQKTFAQLSPGIVDTFSNLTDHIMRADMLRYLVMLADGGVWADIDVLPHQPISEWIPPEFGNAVNLVIGIENDHNKRPIWPGLPYSVQLAQYSLLAKPNHPAIVTLVDQVCENLQAWMGSHADRKSLTTFEDVMMNTGPFVFTDVMMKYFKNVTGEEHTGDELNGLEEPKLIGDVLVLPKDRFGWLPQENTHPKAYALVEHLFIGSWRESHPGR